MLQNAGAQCFWRKLRDERFSINLIPDHRIGWQKQEEEEATESQSTKIGFTLQVK